MNKIYCFELFYCGEPIVKNEYDLQFALEGFERVDDRLNDIQTKLYELRGIKDVLSICCINKVTTVYLVSKKFECITNEIVLEYCPTYRFDDFPIKDYTETYTINHIIQLSQTEYIFYKEDTKFKVSARLYNRNFNEKYRNVRICSSEWYGLRSVRRTPKQAISSLLLTQQT